MRNFRPVSRCKILFMVLQTAGALRGSVGREVRWTCVGLF